MELRCINACFRLRLLSVYQRSQQHDCLLVSVVNVRAIGPRVREHLLATESIRSSGAVRDTLGDGL
jgi:hypothetical protein